MGSLWLGSDQWPATHQFKTVTISAGCPLEWGAAVAARISMNIYWKHTLPSSLPVTDWLDIIFSNILCFDLCLFHVFLIQITWDLINIGPNLNGGLFWWDSGVWRYLYCVWDKTYRNTNSNETTNIERVLHYCWREHAPSNKVVRGTLWHFASVFKIPSLKVTTLTILFTMRRSSSCFHLVEKPILMSGSS